VTQAVERTANELLDGSHKIRTAALDIASDLRTGTPVFANWPAGRHPDLALNTTWDQIRSMQIGTPQQHPGLWILAFEDAFVNRPPSFTDLIYTEVTTSGWPAWLVSPLFLEFVTKAETLHKRHRLSSADGIRLVAELVTTDLQMGRRLAPYVARQRVGHTYNLQGAVINVPGEGRVIMGDFFNG
jgi:hypothetical protein